MNTTCCMNSLPPPVARYSQEDAGSHNLAFTFLLNTVIVKEQSASSNDMILPRSDISLLDSGPGHSVFIAGAVGSPAKPRREEDATAADAVTAFLFNRGQNQTKGFR